MSRTVDRKNKRKIDSTVSLFPEIYVSTKNQGGFFRQFSSIERNIGETN
jgi:hypothetical protein